MEILDWTGRRRAGWSTTQTGSQFATDLKHLRNTAPVLTAYLSNRTLTFVLLSVLGNELTQFICSIYGPKNGPKKAAAKEPQP